MYWLGKICSCKGKRPADRFSATRRAHLCFDYLCLFQWYWTWDKKSRRHLTVMRSMLTVIVFHLGTLALGSLVLAVVRSVRVVFFSLMTNQKPVNLSWTNQMTDTHSL